MDGLKRAGLLGIRWLYLAGFTGVPLLSGTTVEEFATAFALECLLTVVAAALVVWMFRMGFIARQAAAIRRPVSRLLRRLLLYLLAILPPLGAGLVAVYGILPGSGRDTQFQLIFFGVAFLRCLAEGSLDCEAIGASWSDALLAIGMWFFMMFTTALAIVCLGVLVSPLPADTFPLVPGRLSEQALKLILTVGFRVCAAAAFLLEPLVLLATISYDRFPFFDLAGLWWRQIQEAGPVERLKAAVSLAALLLAFPLLISFGIGLFPKVVFAFLAFLARPSDPEHGSPQAAAVVRKIHEVGEAVTAINLRPLHLHRMMRAWERESNENDYRGR